jgi:UDP-N-acetylglucosamine 2-epimerase (non-hydrolysing)
MLKVLSVIGTRPEAIKMAPVIHAMKLEPKKIRSMVCVTGQHHQMLNQVLEVFDIKPDIDLAVMQPNQTLSQLTALLLEGLDRAVSDENPDWVLAQGDTTTVFVAALVAFYRRVRFGHVEAGLRTGDLSQPFPEEMNRRLADTLSTIYFAPTERARKALLGEGICPANIRVTGNTVIDALWQVAERPFDWDEASLGRLRDEPFVLITAHRRENFGEPFRELCLAIRHLAQQFDHDGVQFVYPVHLNPNVRAPVQEILSGLQNVTLIEPVDYFCMVHLMKHAEVILTDSGGIQEEAPTFGVPVLVMRETTERPEGVETGMVRLVGTGRENIIGEVSRLLRDPSARDNWPRGCNPYGDGKAAGRIVEALLHYSNDR